MRVLGIDPGTRVCGYGVIDADGPRIRPVRSGTVRSKSSVLARRLKVLYDGLIEVIEESDPDVAAVEGAFYGTNARTAIKIGEGRGMVLLAVTTCGLEVHEYAPAMVKKAVAGTGRAQKSQVQKMVARILGLNDLPTPHDASDALAIAICHCHRMRIPGVK